jgi:hypothetical protein
MKRTLLILLLVFVMFTAVVLLPRIPANAAGYGYGYISSNNTGGAIVRAQPNVNSADYVWAPNDYRLTMYCWVDGGWADGNYWTNRWFQVSVPYWRYGGVGYINASLVAQPQPTLPHC